MNIEETKEAIKVMQAYVDGKDIEMKDRDTHEWRVNTFLAWNFGINRYRIAEPKPVEIEVGMEIYDGCVNPLSHRIIRMMSEFQCCYSYECNLFIEDTSTICHRYHTIVNGTKRKLKAPEAN